MQHEQEMRNGTVKGTIACSMDEQMLRQRMQELYEKSWNDPNTVAVRQRKIGRNDLCPCGSGVMFKKCCLCKL